MSTLTGDLRRLQVRESLSSRWANNATLEAWRNRSRGGSVPPAEAAASLAVASATAGPEQATAQPPVEAPDITPPAQPN